MVRDALVTGAYGFVGRHMARHLANEGYRVVGIGHGSFSHEESVRWGISEWHVADVTLDALLTYGGIPDVVVHCAGSGSVGFSVAHPYQDFQRTVATAMAVLEYSRIYSPESSLVLPSSAAVYGVAKRLPIKESDPLCPLSPYGVHKRIVEEVFRSYAESYRLRAVIVRFFSLYGNGLRKQLLWDACNKAMRGDMNFFGTGEEIRDWLHIDDATRLTSALVEHASQRCPIFNGGSGRGISVRDALVDIIDAYGCKSDVRFSGKARVGDPLGYCADVSRALEIGWQPTVEWRVGVAQYIEWFLGGGE